jgi:hypothetical protein
MTPVRHQDYEVIRIMVASPSDVVDERNCASDVIESVNKHFAMPLGIMIQLRRWEDVSPAVHDLGAQGHIDSELNIADFDYVVGIFWRRFGTPTISGETGTEHEVRNAYALWTQHKRPQVMLYFSKYPYSFSTPEELDQCKNVLRFKEEFQGRGLVQEYAGPEVFCTMFRNWLTRLVAERVNARGALISLMPCFVSASSPYLRPQGSAELVGEICLLFPVSPVAQSITCSITVFLNTNITNNLLTAQLLADVFLCVADQSLGIVRVQGCLVGLNQVRFENVQLDLRGPRGTREIRIAGLRANAFQIGIASPTYFTDARLTAFLQVQSSAGELVHVVNPSVSVGVLRLAPRPFVVAQPSAPGLSALRRSGINSNFVTTPDKVLPEVTFAVLFREGYPGLFTSSEDECRYVDVKGASNSKPTGTRFLVQFSNVPPEIQLYVTTRDLQPAGSSPSAVLIGTDTNGNGEYAPVPPSGWSSQGIPITRIAVTSGNGFATWEWVRTEIVPRIEDLSVAFGVVLAARPGQASQGTMMIQGSLAPLSNLVGPSESGPLPRFGNVAPWIPAFTMSDDLS